MSKHGTVFGGALLVAGTTIGGGMLALPVLTSPGGFLPSIIIYLICWLFMSATGILFLELSLHMEEGVNIVTMAERTLGIVGKIFAWGMYLFLFYCLTLAYIVGCGDILSTFFKSFLPRALGPFVFLLLFAPFVFSGAKIVGKLNYLLMFALGFFYLGFVVLGAPMVEIENLKPANFGLSLMALPIAFTSFAFQGIVPTLTAYLNYQPSKVKKSIWIGTGLALITYIIWQWLILGIIPFSGEGGLESALKEGRNAVYPLQSKLGHPLIFILGEYFAFFALLTSFFGVTLGLFDFLADGLKIEKTNKGKIFLSFLVFIPPLAIATIYPDIFLKALDFAGGYGCSLLLGLLPILMVLKLRATHPNYTPQLGGGKITLLSLGLFVAFELIVMAAY